MTWDAEPSAGTGRKAGAAPVFEELQKHLEDPTYTMNLISTNWRSESSIYTWWSRSGRTRCLVSLGRAEHHLGLEEAVQHLILPGVGDLRSGESRRSTGIWGGCLYIRFDMYYKKMHIDLEKNITFIFRYISSERWSITFCRKAEKPVSQPRHKATNRSTSILRDVILVWKSNLPVRNISFAGIFKHTCLSHRIECSLSKWGMM